MALFRKCLAVDPACLAAAEGLATMLTDEGTRLKQAGQVKIPALTPNVQRARKQGEQERMRPDGEGEIPFCPMFQTPVSPLVPNARFTPCSKRPCHPFFQTPVSPLFKRLCDHATSSPS